MAFYPTKRRRMVQPNSSISVPSKWDRATDQLYPMVKNVNTHTMILFLLLGMVVIIGFLLLTDAVSVGQSQTQGLVDPTATALIPFDFWIAGTHLPAGQYGLYRSLGLNSVVVLRNMKTKAQDEAFLLPTSGPVAIRDYKLIFVTRTGKRYLREIWNSDGRAILTPEFATEIAPSDARSEVPLRLPSAEHSVAAGPNGKIRDTRTAGSLHN